MRRVRACREARVAPKAVSIFFHASVAPQEDFDDAGDTYLKHGFFVFSPSVKYPAQFLSCCWNNPFFILPLLLVVVHYYDVEGIAMVNGIAEDCCVFPAHHYCHDLMLVRKPSERLSLTYDYLNSPRFHHQAFPVLNPSRPFLCTRCSLRTSDRLQDYPFQGCASSPRNGSHRLQ